MKYKACIFDFDFTLADATSGIIESANYALMSMNYAKCGELEIKKTVGMSLKETFTALTGSIDDDKKTLFASMFKEKADEVMTLSTNLLPGAVNILNRLKENNIKTAIVTSKLHYRIVEALQKFNISNLIDCIVGFEDVKEAKPSPEGLLMAINLLAVQKHNVLYVGDSIIDAKTAQNASVDFAAVTTGTTKAADFLQYPNILTAGSLSEIILFI